MTRKLVGRDRRKKIVLASQACSSPVEGSREVGGEGNMVRLAISIPSSDSHGRWSEEVRRSSKKGWKPLREYRGEMCGGALSNVSSGGT